MPWHMELEKKTSLVVSLQTLTITESFTNACQGTWCVIMSENSSRSLCWVFGHSGCELFPVPWQAYWGRPQLTFLSCFLWLCNKDHHRDVTRHSDQHNVSKGVEAVILLVHMLASLPAEEKTLFNSGVIINASKSICFALKVLIIQEKSWLQGVWLVWQFQGERTLDHYMKQKNFPENIAETILGKKVQYGINCQLHALMYLFWL